MFDVAVELERAKLRRRFPRISEPALNRKIDEWLLDEKPLDPTRFVKVSWPDRRPVSSKRS